MRSQAWYNTNIQKFLTQFLIFLIDNKKASYKSFQELSDITPAAFSKYIKYFKEMIIDLKLNMTLIVEKIQETEIDKLFSKYPPLNDGIKVEKRPTVEYENKAI